MFVHIKQMLPGLLCFGESLAAKCMSLNNEPCMFRPFLIDLNLVELNYYPFMISWDQCSESCKSVDDLSTKIHVPIKTKDCKVSCKV